MKVKIIVAMGKDGSIGKDGDLIWKIPADLQRFKALTTGHPVIMGRKTWESLPKRPLPNRRNIVLTRQPDFNPEGGEVVNSIEKALDMVGNEETFIIGGAEIYNSFLPFTDEIYLTLVNAGCENADAFLKLNLEEDWEKVEESGKFVNPEGVEYQYLTYRKARH